MGRYSDDQLATAVANSQSWRGVLRALGLQPASGSAMRSARKLADGLGLDYGHFRGKRRWTEAQLARAIADATSWEQVCETLGLAGGSSTAHLRGHAVRLGFDYSHFESRHKSPSPEIANLRPQRSLLSRAGPLLAAGWFEMSGCSVSWPLEPSRYDLLVWMNDRAERVQVKTTTVRDGATWQVRLATTRNEIRTYGPDEIDHFFVIDGDYNYYLIPIGVVGGLIAINLSAYQDFLLPNSALRHQ